MNKVIWIQGGFGNVLFQLIPGIYLSEKSTVERNKSVVLSTYLTKESFISLLLGWKIHDKEYEYFLSKSSFQFDLLKINNLCAFKHIIFGLLSKKINKPFLGNVFFRRKIDGNQFYSNDHYFGYYQNKSFLQNHEKELEKIFNELRIVYYKTSNRVECAVHFRYGDSIWARQNFEYYNLVKEHLKKRECKITIVTDSKNEAADFFKELTNCKIVSRDVTQDFSILLSAKILYTAPSTFSWWAGNASISNEIYMPKKLKSKIGSYNSNIREL
jgi:hypothetical protein